MLLRRSYLYILLFTCLLTACVGDVKEKDSFSAHNSVPSLDQVISPIDKSAFYFIEIVDFLAQDTILLNRQTEAFFELVIRNLFTGKEEIFIVRHIRLLWLHRILITAKLWFRKVSMRLRRAFLLSI